MGNPYNYSIYFDFIESYLPSGFKNINAEDPIITKLEALTVQNDQFFLVRDLTNIRILFNSSRSKEMLGIDPAKNNPREMLYRIHPDDLERFGLGRTKLISMEKELYIGQKGSELLSSTFRMFRPDHGYFGILFQCYLFFSPIPYRSVFEVQVHTNIDSFGLKDDQFHYYVGKDISNFRFPDQKLMDISQQLSTREMEVIRLIEKGLSSKEIAEKLFLSVHTVNTHRGNILKKTEKSNVSDLIYSLKEDGLL